MDVAPTLLDLVGIEPPRTLRGRSLQPLVRGRDDLESPVYSEFPHSRMIHAQTIQSRSRKLVVGDPVHGDRAYDLERDAGELEPLALESDVPTGDLREALDQIRRSANARRRQLRVPLEEPSPDTTEKLRALGYAE